MAHETRTIPGYERLTASGAVQRRFAGVEARIKEGDSAEAASATWLILASTIPGITPRVGDRCWGTDGIERTVTEVSTINDQGEWPCVCTREVAEGGE